MWTAYITSGKRRVPYGRGPGHTCKGPESSRALDAPSCYLSLIPLTQNVHKTWSYDISYHNSWYRSRKIKEDSSTEREKSPLQFEPIFITVQCTSRSQDFFLMKNYQEIFKLATLLMIENPLFLMQIGNVWPKFFFIFFFFFFFFICNALYLFWKCH